MADLPLARGQNRTFGILAGGLHQVTTMLTYSSGKVHGGIDIGCPIGTDLYAPFDGTIVDLVDGVPNNRPGERIYSGKPSNWILLKSKIRTNDNKMQDATIFLQHLSPGLAVRKGQQVKAGQYLADTGNSGNSSGPHLHAGAQWVRTGRGHGAGTRYDHINMPDLRIWPPDRFVLPGQPRPGRAAPAPVKEQAVAAPWFKYSGKPSGTLHLRPDTYTRLDAGIPAPPRSGLEMRMCYLNVAPAWKLPKNDPMYWYQTAAIRVRWTRSGATPDPTAYQTFAVTPWEDFLITHTHWEQGEANRGGHWDVRIRGMITSATIGTRYAKGALL